MEKLFNRKQQPFADIFNILKEKSEGDTRKFYNLLHTEAMEHDASDNFYGMMRTVAMELDDFLTYEYLYSSMVKNEVTVTAAFLTAVYGNKYKIAMHIYKSDPELVDLMDVLLLHAVNNKSIQFIQFLVLHGCAKYQNPRCNVTAIKIDDRIQVHSVIDNDTKDFSFKMINTEGDY